MKKNPTFFVLWFRILFKTSVYFTRFRRWRNSSKEKERDQNLPYIQLLPPCCMSNMLGRLPRCNAAPKPWGCSVLCNILKYFSNITSKMYCHFRTQSDIEGSIIGTNIWHLPVNLKTKICSSVSWIYSSSNTNMWFKKHFPHYSKNKFDRSFW